MHHESKKVHFIGILACNPISLLSESSILPFYPSFFMPGILVRKEGSVERSIELFLFGLGLDAIKLVLKGSLLLINQYP